MEKKTIILWILIALAIVLSIVNILAVSWPFSKAKTCESFNVTGTDCEKFWCESIQEGNYSLERELCEFTVNNTIIVNETNQTAKLNVTINETNFYNKSDIDSMLSDVKINFSQKYVLQNDFEDLEDKIYEKNSISSGITSSELMIGLLVIVVLVGGFYLMNKNKQQTPLQKGVAPEGISKIQTSKEKEKDFDIKEVLKKLDNLEKEKPKKKGKPKSDDEEGDEGED